MSAKDEFPLHRLIALPGAMLALCLSAALGAPEATLPSTVHFSVFALRPVPGLAVLPSDDHPPQPIQLYPTARSSLVSYRGPMPVRLVNMITGNALAEVWIPPTITRALIVVAPGNGPESGGHLVPHLVDENPPSSGTVRLTVLNLSGLSLRGWINARPMAIRAGLNPIPGVSGTARLELRAVLKEREYHSYADAVTLTAAERSLLILFPPYYRGSLEVQARMLREEMPPNSTGASSDQAVGGQKRDLGGARGRD